MSREEKQPLLGNLSISDTLATHYSEEEGGSSKRTRAASSLTSSHSSSKTGRELDEQGVHLKKHITLPYAVAIIVGNVIGSGIFLSPKGVTQNIGSVGASLLIWALTGVYNLAQALCYAELGALIPKAGGDYAYLFYILGPLPAFMTAWVHVLMIASSSCAVIAQTAALYAIEPLDLSCHQAIITYLAVVFITSLAIINILSAKLGVRIQTLFTVAKLSALAVIIIVGFIQLGKGHTSNFQEPFQNTNTNPGSVALSILDGYFAYKGWELINALPEEMVNPQRDLPLAVWIAMSIVTVVYTLTNMAFFTVLSPEQLLESDAVALSFADQTLGKASWVISIAVTLSCLGAVNGDFLSNSRYLFAGGRFRQMPQIFSMINLRRFTPIPAIAALCILALSYCLIKDLQALEQYASLTVQMKMLLTLAALFYLRWKRPELHRPVKVNTIVAVLVFVIMVGLVALSFYKSPFNTGMGCVVFLVGVPIYYLGRFLLHNTTANSCMDCVTRFLQKLLLLCPESSTTEEQMDWDKTQ